MKPLVYSVIVLSGCMLFAQAPAFAKPAQDSTVIEGAKLCTRFLPRNERKYGIPQHLLSAIASTESGRWHDGLSMALPWPWTVNTGGKGYYFNSKQEAVTFVQKLRAEGVKSMDVGCMQVNLMHHPDAFASVNQAFDPAYNIDYAAQFLRSNYDDAKSWRAAAAAYHSKTPSLGSQYIGSVYKSWQRIIARVRQAKLGTSTAQAERALAQEFAVADRATLLPAERAVPAKPAYKPIQMRIIQVKDATTGTIKVEQGVRVMRTAVSAEAAQPVSFVQELPSKSVQSDENFAIKTAMPEIAAAQTPSAGAKIIRVNAATSTAQGPKFIFN